MFYQIGIFEKFTKFAGRDLCWSRFFIKKKTLTQMFSCKFFEIFKTTFLKRTPPVASPAYVIIKFILSIRSSILVGVLIKFDFLCVNPLMASVPHHLETSQLICIAIIG